MLGQSFKIDGRLAAVILGVESISVFRNIPLNADCPTWSPRSAKSSCARLRLTRPDGIPCGLSAAASANFKPQSRSRRTTRRASHRPDAADAMGSGIAIHASAATAG